MEESIVKIVESLAGPAGAMILLAVVLYGVWKLLDRWISVFNEHAEKLSASLTKIADDIHELREDISQVAKQVAIHEVRITHIEKDA